MYQVGIDIGSSATKVIVMDTEEVIKTLLLDTGFSSRKIADDIYTQLESEGITKDNARYAATGYGRISVPYADEVVTEITCHGKGAQFLFGTDGTNSQTLPERGILLPSVPCVRYLPNQK